MVLVPLNHGLHAAHVCRSPRGGAAAARGTPSALPSPRRSARPPPPSRPRTPPPPPAPTRQKSHRVRRDMLMKVIDAPTRPKRLDLCCTRRPHGKRGANANANARKRRCAAALRWARLGGGGGAPRGRRCHSRPSAAARRAAAP
eukprot:SAG11_NODE_5947_length_1427_cov_2.299699_1_plen_143_part_10